MTADLLSFPNADEEPAIELDEPAIELEPEPESPSATSLPATASPTSIETTALMEVLPADFRLPALIKFIPNPQLRVAADQAGTYALGLTVDGPDGLQRADLALQAVRTAIKSIEEHFSEPASIANELHKAITSVRGEWCTRGKQAIETVGKRMYAEQRRLDAVALEERRKAQAEADRLAREAAKREADAAAKAQAPPAVVQELQRQAETATAPPVPVPASMPAPLRGSTTVERWKARLVGTRGEDEPNPEMAMLNPEQRLRVFEAMRAVLEGKAPLTLFEINWSGINKRAGAEKATFAIPGFEAFDVGGMRAKGQRTR
jgi:hypothetical protein